MIALWETRRYPVISEAILAGRKSSGASSQKHSQTPSAINISVMVYRGLDRFDSH